MESTPNYFQLPYSGIDIARNIKASLGDPRLVVLFRNPVDHYESAYIHHMMKGRTPHTEIITKMDNSHKMLELGHFAQILRHWRSVFPDINVQLYDRLRRDSFGLIGDVMSYLELDNDIRPDQLDFRTNEKVIKIKSISKDWKAMPKLRMDIRLQLIEYYQPHVQELSDLLQVDLNHWLTVPKARWVPGWLART